MNRDARGLALSYALESHAEELELLRSLAQIPAPSHHEELRASFVRDWLDAAGAVATIDEAKNVICPIGDDGRKSLVVFAAHTDVVFGDTEALPLAIDPGGRVWRAPGIGDDTSNLVNLLMAAKYLLGHSLDSRFGLLVVANSCEEGLGNLDGTRHLFETFGGRVVEYLSFDGYAGTCTNSAVGSHRYRVSCDTAGGHSYVDFGSPSAIKVLSDVIQELYGIGVPDGPRVTYNVGTIGGGTSVNSIAEHAEMLYEYRSPSDESLSAMRERLDSVLRRHRADGARVDATLLGVRPGNGDVDASRLASLTGRSVDAIRGILGIAPVVGDNSTDSNIPLSLGIPANTMGSVVGGNPHTREEWVDTESLTGGLALVLALMLGYAEG